MWGAVHWKEKKQHEENRKRETKWLKKGNRCKGDEWERPKEELDAEEDDWGRATKFVWFLIENKTKSEQAFLADYLPQKWNMFHFFCSFLQVNQYGADGNLKITF